MCRELKNLKISHATHQRLKVEAAKQSVPIAEYAYMVICYAFAGKPDIEKLRKAFQNFEETAGRMPSERT